MRVLGRRVERSTAPAALRLYLGQLLVSIGKNYEVYAVAVFEGSPFMLIVNDLGRPSWTNGWLFDLVDSKIPGDWICTAFHDEPLLLLGPYFIAHSREAYEGMVEMHPEQVDRFWKHIAARGLEEASD